MAYCLFFGLVAAGNSALPLLCVVTGVRKPDIEAVSVGIPGQAPFVGRLSSLDCSGACFGGREIVHKH